VCSQYDIHFKFHSEDNLILFIMEGGGSYDYVITTKIVTLIKNELQKL
jgi:hypothetical protein